MRTTRESILRSPFESAPLPFSLVASWLMRRTPVSRSPVTHDELTSAIASSCDELLVRWLSLKDATRRSRTLSNGNVQDAKTMRQKT